MKFSYWFSGIAFVVFLVALFFFIHSCVLPDVPTIPPQFTDTSLFLTAVLNTTGTPQEDISGITVPHHLLARDLIADTFLLASHGLYGRVVVVSPDHYNLGDTDISLSSRDFGTVFGDLTTDQLTVKKLGKFSYVSTSDFFYREHGIQAILPFVKYYFPKAQIIAVTFKEGTDKKELDEFVDLLEAVLDRETLIVQSTDFSHYLPVEVANTRDKETISVIKSGDPQKIFSLHQPANLDSIAAQYIQSRLQRDLYGATPHVTGHKNSQDYTEEKLAKTTSYITQVYLVDSSKLNRAVARGVTFGGFFEGFVQKYGQVFYACAL